MKRTFPQVFEASRVRPVGMKYPGRPLFDPPVAFPGGG